MENCYLKSTWFLMNFISWILLVFKTSGLESTNETDHLALLDFKNRITEDPLQIMNLWNDTVNFCNWVGVTCSPSNGRVMILNLHSQRLVGSIPPSIGNLTFLTELTVLNNNFNGELPEELGRLLRLQYLNLTMNSFTGRIPTNLSHCTDLRVLSISYNGLTGPIPDRLSSLSNLTFFGFGVNNLTGIIPAWIGNFSALLILELSRNNLYGSIPNELGRLSHLGHFNLYGNELSGTIPSSLFNISSIYYFGVAQNQLQGQLPPDVGLTLPNLEIFGGAINNFSGFIPLSLPNASGLGLFDFAENRLMGTVPTNLGSLQGLHRFNVDQNELGNEEVGDLNFLTFLANCTSLEVLGLAQNRFGGELPDSIANLSTSLDILTLGGNLINGKIPVGIGNLINLTLLGLEMNYLTGSVPDAMGKLQQLEGLYLNLNRFSGQIPGSLGNLTSLARLFMEENRLEGSIPPTLGNCHSLLVLNLTSNNLSGSIPKEVIGLSSLSISLSIANNSLTGSLPFEVAKLKNLKVLHISENKLLGEIPSTLGSCISLENLLMEGNLIQGTIPESLETLKGLVDIDLSRNNLSGKLPEFLGKLSSLKTLNLSFNNFEGEVSKEGIFANASAVSVLGNGKLCGGVLDLHLPACFQNKSQSSGTRLRPKVYIPATILVIFVIISCSVAACYLIRNSRKRSLTASSTKDWQLGISYQELFTSTNGFSVDSLLGSGSFGSVYKGVLHDDGSIVAVKVFDLQQQGAFKSFMDECEALRSIRHRNLLKIISVCSSVDHQGNDFKCLVFEFMSKGNLDQWLHPRDDEQYRTKSLNIVQRLNIAIDVASALDYLHNHCQTTIVHCDLKPSNILLDDDMTAHVGDFGLARFLFQSSNDPSKNQTMSVELKGSIGYIPPAIVSTVHDRFGNLINLTLLGLEMNYLTGSVPDAMGKLQQLEGLYLNLNRFSGQIPGSLGNLTSLTRLFMEENRLQGSIPPSLGNCQSLSVLNLTSNNLSGSIPNEVIGLSSLSISLSMANNSLTGSLPFEVGRLINLKELHISENKLSGEIPSTLGSCISLENLLMEGNLLQGTIPKSLETLKGLVDIDLSRNNLSGKLPEFLGKLSSLKTLNLSFNNFEGEMSKEGIFANASVVSVLGNDKLCGGVLDLHLPACSQDKSHSSGIRIGPKVYIPAAILVIFVIISCSVAACYLIRNSRKRSLTASSTMDWQLGISYQELVRSTNGFSMDNLLGSGSFGSVYKGVLPGDGSIVAVKLFDLQQQGAFKSFMDECKALRSIRHRNLLKIISVCSSVDYQGNDFKCLVFEFMSNGNLDQWLHPRDDEQYRTKSLNVVQRLNIAIDVASALDYLHNHCQTTIVHCDLKPSNILLDDDMTAHVGDFGLARFHFQSSNDPSKNQTMSVGLKGSIGYIPPEYGMGGQVATLGDIYSYGILLLEMFIGKRPTEDIFKDGLSIHKYVAMALPERVMDIVDPSLLLDEREDSVDENEEDKIQEKAIINDDDDPQNNATSRMMECLVSVMRIGLSCSNSLPSDRMPINAVVNQMNAIRDSFLGLGSRKGRRRK